MKRFHSREQSWARIYGLGVFVLLALVKTNLYLSQPDLWPKAWLTQGSFRGNLHKVRGGGITTKEQKELENCWSTEGDGFQRAATSWDVDIWKVPGWGWFPPLVLHGWTLENRQDPSSLWTSRCGRSNRQNGFWQQFWFALIIGLGSNHTITVVLYLKSGAGPCWTKYFL